MNSYSIHFVIAIVLSALFAALFRNPVKKRLLASVCAPIILYVCFYNYDYGLLGGGAPYAISYVGAVYSVTMSLTLVSVRRTEADTGDSTRPLISLVVSELGVVLSIFVMFTIPWAVDTFPLSNVEAVLFTVFAGENEGAEEFVISGFVNKVAIPVLKCSIFVLAVQLVLTFVLLRSQSFYSAGMWKIRLLFNQRRFVPLLWQMQRATLAVLGAYASVLFFVLPGIVMSAPFRALIQRPVDSEFYRNNYVHPDSVEIRADGSPMNLVVIFLESMEKNFAQYTPEIVELEGTALDFLPGGKNVSGTSWTIAGITGKLCGIPLNMPMGIEEYLGNLPTYVPYAKCLMDVLADKGYNQLYAQGTDGSFTQKKDFWRAHGNVNIHDIKYYKSVGKIPENYLVFWGFEDRKLYHLVKEELDSIASLDNPFAFYMLTIDTHQPRGWLDDSCRIALKNIGITDIKLNHFPEALRCASMQLESFIDWMREQTWFDKTVVFVMGDHATPSLSAKAGISQSDSLYWTNFVINPAKSVGELYRRGRVYSSLDMFPTILESMGFELDGHAIALGRSLYADSPTLLEMYGQRTLDSLLRERSIQYDYFLMGH